MTLAASDLQTSTFVPDEEDEEVENKKKHHLLVPFWMSRQAQARERTAPRSAENRYAAQMKRLAWLLIHTGAKNITPGHWRAAVATNWDNMAEAVIQKVGSPWQLPTFRNNAQSLFEVATGEYLAGKISKEEYLARVELIARDQTLKLAAQAVRDQSRTDKYIWWTMLDDRVRDGHALLHGSEQAWESPPDTGRREGPNNPGEAVMCRCIALPPEKNKQDSPPDTRIY